MVLPRLLIIGHGYVGSVLARQFVDSSFTVRAVNRSAEPGLPYPVLPGDVSSLESVRALASSLGADAPELIVHCASSSRGGPDAYRSVFIEGLRNLHTAFPGVPVIFTSSSSVYGQVDGSLVDEDSDTEPDRETSRLLCEAEQITREAGGIALRLAGIYGPGRSVHVKKMIEGSATIDEGEVSRYLNQIHRDDAASAIRHLATVGADHFRGRLFNVVEDTPLTQRQCYEGLSAILGLPLPPEAPPELDRKRAWTNKIVSNAALRETGWRPLYPSFLDAVRHDPDLVPSIRETVETD
jgi:nucleoside-diphosphate-sugar epimerase